MLENVPVRRVVHGGLTIEGYSRAAVQSYWRIPELKIGFDLGAHPWEFMGTPHWFLTHMHLDHFAALPVYIARRRMMKMDPPIIHLPSYAIDDVKKILHLFQRLDRGRMNYELVGVEPGMEFSMSKEIVVTTIPTTHTIPSFGYIIWDRRHKLKEEFLGFPGEKIRDLRLSGVEITREIRTPLVAYTGDTSPPGLDACESLFRAKILITEMSFIRAKHRREKIHKYGHLHLDDFIERAERFQNELIICAHASTRYHNDEILRTVEKRLPPNLKNRLQLWL
jgi:ribonuclease Z